MEPFCPKALGWAGFCSPMEIHVVLRTPTSGAWCFRWILFFPSDYCAVQSCSMPNQELLPWRMIFNFSIIQAQKLNQLNQTPQVCCLCLCSHFFLPFFLFKLPFAQALAVLLYFRNSYTKEVLSFT